MATKIQYIESVLRGVGMTLCRAQLETDTGPAEVTAAAATLANVLAEIGVRTTGLAEAVEALHNNVLAETPRQTPTGARTRPEAPDVQGGLKVETPTPPPPMPPQGTFATKFAELRR